MGKRSKKKGGGGNILSLCFCEHKRENHFTYGVKLTYSTENEEKVNAREEGKKLRQRKQMEQGFDS